MSQRLTDDNGHNRLVCKFAVALLVAMFSRASLNPAVFGGIDGIITTYSVIMTGVGGKMAARWVITMAVSNLITDGWSMGFGEFMGKMAERSKNAADFKAQRETINDIEQGPAGSMVQSTEKYIGLLVNNGMNNEDAETVAIIYAKRPRSLLEELLKKEFGLEYTHEPSENDFVQHLASSLVIMLSFFICGCIPVLAHYVGNAAGIDSEPYLLALNSGCSITALFVLGMIADRVARKSYDFTAHCKSGVVYALMGGMAFGISYGIGRAIEG